MKNIQIAIWGFGAMGAGMARMISKKTGLMLLLYATCTRQGLAEVQVRFWESISGRM